MEIAFYTNYVARSVVAEKLNHSRREPVVLDRIQLRQTLTAAVEAISATVQQFITNIDREMRRWVDTQKACTPINYAMVEC